MPTNYLKKVYSYIREAGSIIIIYYFIYSQFNLIKVDYVLVMKYNAILDVSVLVSGDVLIKELYQI